MKESQCGRKGRGRAALAGSPGPLCDISPPSTKTADAPGPAVAPGLPSLEAQLPCAPKDRRLEELSGAKEQ